MVSSVRQIIWSEWIIRLLGPVNVEGPSAVPPSGWTTAGWLQKLVYAVCYNLVLIHCLLQIRDGGWLVQLHGSACARTSSGPAGAFEPARASGHDPRVTRHDPRTIGMLHDGPWSMDHGRFRRSSLSEKFK